MQKASVDWVCPNPMHASQAPQNPIASYWLKRENFCSHRPGLYCDLYNRAGRRCRHLDPADRQRDCAIRSAGVAAREHAHQLYPVFSRYRCLGNSMFLADTFLVASDVTQPTDHSLFCKEQDVAYRSCPVCDLTRNYRQVFYRSGLSAHRITGTSIPHQTLDDICHACVSCQACVDAHKKPKTLEWIEPQPEPLLCRFQKHNGY